VFPRAISLVVALLALAGEMLCAQEYSFRRFGGSEGLTNLAIRRIYQDRVGFIWVSTENGIFRYDGDRFEGFGTAQGMPQNSGAAFGDAPDGSLLVGGTFGLYHLSGNRFEKVPGAFNSVAWAQGIQSDGKGHTYLGTDIGLVELSSQPGQTAFSMRIIPQPEGTTTPSASGILLDGDAVWYGCGHELCRMDSNGTRVFSRESGLPDRELQVILKDGVGNLWVRAKNGGVFEWPAGKTKFEKPLSPLPSENLGGVPTVDSGGRILLTSPSGLLIDSEKGWQMIDRSVGLRGTVYSAFEDRQHSLWIGTAGLCLTQWRGYREWESYSEQSGLASDIAYEVLPNGDGSLWVGTEAGLVRAVRSQFGMSFKKVPEMSGFAVHSLQRASNGNLWIGTETRGVANFDPKSGKIVWFSEAQGLTGKGAYKVHLDSQQRLWAATDAGLFMSAPPYARFSRVADLPATRVWAVTQGTDGTIWAGGSGGLFEFTAGKWKTLTKADGLSNLEVLSLGAGPNGVMWVGYRFGGGIDRIHPQAGGVRIEKGVQRSGSNGLIYFLHFDSKGHLWAGTEHGVDVWDGTRWIHYDMNDGLAWDDCNLNAFGEEADGTLWIGTSAGLSRFNPLPHRAPDVPLEVVFTGLSIGKNDVSALRNPSFGSHSNSLVAGYSALNASRQSEVIFRYRLGGDNASWTETTQRELQFANLAPGSYRLEIDARDSDGPWSGHVTGFPFSIQPPWYFSWWFIALGAFIPLSVAAITLRLRFLGAQKRERELVKVVAERTADLSRANEELARLSYTDALTGLANRRIFNQTLETECSRLRRMNSVLTLLMIDVDHFKTLNDSLGHQIGDNYLMLVGSELSRLCRRKVDVPARYGGEEFAIVLPDTTADYANQFAEDVRKAIAAMQLPHLASSIAPILTVSVGVATASRDRCCTPEALVAAADQALYAAKRGGRNRVSVFQPEADSEECSSPPVEARS